jgi:RNA polymerase sigma-70 factor (ECF subfamily)
MAGYPRRSDLQHATDDVLALLDAQGVRIYGRLLRLTLRHDVADDLMQELFVKLRESSALSRANDPAAYAARAATNLALDWRRSQSRLRERVARLEAVNATRSTYHCPLDELVNREETEQVLDAVSELPSPGREILVMHYLEHEDYEAIGKHFQRTAHQVRAMGHKAMEQLRRRLGIVRSALHPSGSFDNDK